MAYNWAQIESGATFHALVGALLLHEDPLVKVFDRAGPDGGIDAFSSDRETVHQTKHHANGTPSGAFSDALAELAKIGIYRQAGHRWHDLWERVRIWNLVTNVAFGPADEARWKKEIVPAFKKIGLTAEYITRPALEAWLAAHPGVADAFFGKRPRLFVSLAEHRDALVAREVLQRAYDIPLEGRSSELDAIVEFVTNSPHQVLLIHGPGGVGKSRLALEAALRLIQDGGPVNTVYCGTANLAVATDWYVGVLPEAKALVVLDEPSDPAFVARVLAELRTRTKQWKVLVVARTPNDPAIERLTDPRERLLAPALEVRPLPDDDASRFADKLISPLGFPADQHRRVAKWLVQVCGRFPIWMTVAVKLLESRDDLRDLPADEFRIAAAYLREVLDNTRAEIAGASQILALLRWIALVQPLARTQSEALTFLAKATGIGTPEGVDRAIEDLARRRVISAYGIGGRMIEIRPDVLRDHLLVDWLTFPTEAGARRASQDARGLADQLADAALRGEQTPLDERMIVSLGRMEFLVEPRLRFLDPAADAAVRLAESATDTLAQERTLEFAKAFAFLRPRHLARVAELLRTRDVPVAAHETMFGRFSVPRERILNGLPHELSRAARGATTRDEKSSVLREIAALVDWQAGIPGGGRPPMGGETAADILPRVVQERHGFRSSFAAEAGVLANKFLDGMARGDTPRASWDVLLRALLAIERHDAYTDPVDRTSLRMESFRILPGGAPGRLCLAIRERLWEIVEADLPDSPAQQLAWKLLDDAHRNLGAARNEATWGAAVVDDIKRCGAIAASSKSSLAAKQAARAIWDWHLTYDEDQNLRDLAQYCETAYLADPLISKYARLFGADTLFPLRTDRARDALLEFPTPIEPESLATFFSEALLFTSAHPERWREREVYGFAWELGEARGTDPGVQAFVERYLRQGSTASLFGVARCVASGSLNALRRNGEDAKVPETLVRTATWTPDSSSLMAVLSALYVETGLLVARRYSEADCTFLFTQWDAFSKLNPDSFFLAVGRLLPRSGEVLARARLTFATLEQEARATAVRAIWRGYFETLPHNFVEADVSTAIVENLLELSATLSDWRDIGGQVEWEIREVLKRIPRRPIRWLVDIVRKRVEAFGRSKGPEELDQNNEARLPVTILPPDESCFLDAIESVPDREAKDDDVQAILDLLALADVDSTIEYGLPELMSHLDPHGRIVPGLIATRLADPLRVSTPSAIAEMGRFAGLYGLDSPAWREIAVIACQRVRDLDVPDEDRQYVYDSLFHHGPQMWSGGSPNELHPRWQQAVDAAQAALDKEAESSLRPLWEWRLRCAIRARERETGRIEEEKW